MPASLFVKLLVTPTLVELQGWCSDVGGKTTPDIAAEVAYTAHSIGLLPGSLRELRTCLPNLCDRQGNRGKPRSTAGEHALLPCKYSAC